MNVKSLEWKKPEVTPTTFEKVPKLDVEEVPGMRMEKEFWNLERVIFEVEGGRVVRVF